MWWPLWLLLAHHMVELLRRVCVCVCVMHLVCVLAAPRQFATGLDAVTAVCTCPRRAAVVSGSAGSGMMPHLRALSCCDASRCVVGLLCLLLSSSRGRVSHVCIPMFLARPSRWRWIECERLAVPVCELLRWCWLRAPPAASTRHGDCGWMVQPLCCCYCDRPWVIPRLAAAWFPTPGDERGWPMSPSPRVRRRPVAVGCSVGDVVDELLDAVGVGLALDQRQGLLVLVGVTEHPLARTEQHREHQEVVPVDQARVGEVPAERGTAMDDDRTTVGPLQRPPRRRGTAGS